MNLYEDALDPKNLYPNDYSGLAFPVVPHSANYLNNSVLIIEVKKIDSYQNTCPSHESLIVVIHALEENEGVMVSENHHWHIS